MPASTNALLVVCAVVVAPLRALITSMPLPVVSAPRPPRLVICTFVVPLATAVAPLRMSRSLALALPPSAVPSRSVPPLPTQGPLTVSVVPGTAPTSETVPLWAIDARVWLLPARSSVAPVATVKGLALLSTLAAPARRVPAATLVAPEWVSAPLSVSTPAPIFTRSLAPEIAPVHVRAFPLVSMVPVPPSSKALLTLRPPAPAMTLAVAPAPIEIAPVIDEPVFSVRLLVPPVNATAAARVTPSPPRPPEMVPPLVSARFAPVTPAPPTPLAPLGPPLLLAPPTPPAPPAMVPVLVTVAPAPVDARPAPPSPPAPGEPVPPAPPPAAPPAPPAPPVIAPELLTVTATPANVAPMPPAPPPPPEALERAGANSAPPAPPAPPVRGPVLVKLSPGLVAFR
ncbi:hypothetical protein D9M72_237560 [compost metagenome]